MFLTFGLKRTDIFSLGDLGVQRGVAVYAGKNIAKLRNTGKGKWKYMPEKEMIEIAEKFRTWRSIFMWYMWRIGETDVEAIETS